MAFTEKELEVLRNIIGAVETGGQVYGQGRYDDFTEPFANSSSETAITIGKYQHYGVEAKQLLQRIQKADPKLFRQLDTHGIAEDLKNRNWAKYGLSKYSKKALCIQDIISSSVGRRVQDEMVDEQMQKYAEEALARGVTDKQAQAECCNFRHQGGPGAVRRILAKTKRPYTLESLYAACQTDTGNQVGTYRTRQKKVYEWLKEYWPADSDQDQKPVEPLMPKEPSEPKEPEKKETIGVVNAFYLNFRTEPTSSSKRLKSYPRLKKNDRVVIEKTIVNSKKETWYFVEYKGKHGYLLSKWVTVLK